MPVPTPAPPPFPPHEVWELHSVPSSDQIELDHFSIPSEVLSAAGLAHSSDTDEVIDLVSVHSDELVGGGLLVCPLFCTNCGIRRCGCCNLDGCKQLCSACVRFLPVDAASEQGTSTHNHSDQEEGPPLHCRAMTNYELLQRWNLVPMHLELAIRKVKWLQAAIKDPIANEQFIAAAFGKVRVQGIGWEKELSALSSEGWISDSASPLARSFGEAIELFRGISGTESFFDEWQLKNNSWKALLVSKPLGYLFTSIDPRLLSAAFNHDHSFRTLCQNNELIRLQSEQECTTYKCNFVGSFGACGKSFTNYSKYMTHLISVHKYYHPVSACVPTNYCVNCLSSFASPASAKQHLRNAYRQGHCIADHAHSAWSVQD